MNRILFKKDEINADGIVNLTGVRAKHVLEVLHGKVGQKVRAGVIDGTTGDGIIVETGKAHVVLKCVLNGGTMPVPCVDLILALPRPKVMKRLWSSLASMGVGRIIITNAAKVERNYFDTQWLEKKYYEPLLIEGLMQSSDTRMPQVTICRRLKVFVEDELNDIFPHSSRFVFHINGLNAIQAFEGMKKGRILIAIGPEGGWTDFEVDLLKAHSFTCVSMGARILRSDTACISALALAHAVIDAK